MKGLFRLLSNNLFPLLLVWLGFCLYSWPLLGIADSGGRLLFYIFIVWGAFIALALGMSLAHRREKAPYQETAPPEEDDTC